MDHIESTAELREVVEAIAWVILPEEKKGEEPWLHWLRSMQAKARAAITASMPVGNAAAIREALDALKSLSKSHGTDLPEDVRALLGEMAFTINDALAAPARNCDLARYWLQDLYCNFKPPATVRREMPPEWVDAVMAFCQWLLAPATERKGENNDK